MKIVMTTNQGGPVPVMVCESCGKPITDGRGVVLWSDEDHLPVGKGSEMVVVHQGRCDSRYDPDGDLLSLELPTFTEHLHAVVQEAWSRSYGARRGSSGG